MKVVQRDNTVDIVKAIGIISIIIGHSVEQFPITHIEICRFVYLYHLTVFFFVSGFMYSDKYNDNLPLYCGRRIMGILPKYVLYNSLFVFLHNSLSRISLISAPRYGFSDIMIWLSAGFVMQTNEVLLGAFWFLPVLLIACILFALALLFSQRIAQTLKERISFHVPMSFIMMLFALAGIYYNCRGMNLPYHMQTSFLAVPFIYLGWLTKLNYSKFEKYICRTGYILSAGLLYLCVAVFGFQIELSANIIISPLLFYPISLLGIYFCFSLAKTLLKYRKTSKVMTFIGRNTFHYMALHFLMFKLVDLVSVVLFGSSSEMLSAFPHSFEYGLLYVFASLVLITLILMIFEKMKKKLLAN